jgi:copper chaperone CopZ
MARATLEAPDISCDHCIQSIQKAVTRLPGVRLLSGDASNRQVTLEYDPDKTPIAEIERVMEEEGYPVKK